MIVAEVICARAPKYCLIEELLHAVQRAQNFRSRVSIVRPRNHDDDNDDTVHGCPPNKFQKLRGPYTPANVKTDYTSL